MVIGMSRLSILVVLSGLLVAPASAQDVDARAALLASLKAMGGENLKTIEVSGAGSSSLIGQQYSVDGNWPQFEVANYTRAIDFTQPASRATGDALPPAVQGAPPPQLAPFEQNITPATPAWTQQTQIWVTPWGFLRGRRHQQRYGAVRLLIASE